MRKLTQKEIRELTIDHLNRKRAKLSSLSSLYFVCRFLVFLPNFEVVVEQ